MFRIKKRSRLNYWSCSKFANYIRGTPKPPALEWEEWDKWHDNAKKNYPWRYWITEELLDKLQNLVNFPLDLVYTIRVYIRNRFIDQTHVLKTRLEPGEYYDLDTRILYGLFNELVDLVEIEYAHLSKWDKTKSYKFTGGRCVDAGLDYLKWACNLKYGVNEGLRKGDKLFGQPTPQAQSAQKVKELYLWWKNRDNRPNPHDMFSKEKDGPKYFLKIDKLERDQYKEDNKMLIELIKIRENLWT